MSHLQNEGKNKTSIFISCVDWVVASLILRNVWLCFLFRRRDLQANCMFLLVFSFSLFTALTQQWCNIAIFSYAQHWLIMIYTSGCCCCQNSSDKSPCLSLVRYNFLSFAKYLSGLAAIWSRWHAQLIWWEIFMIVLTPHYLKSMQFSRDALELESFYLSI